MNERPIIVIGGGIGGLSAAIALRRVGMNAIVYERVPELREIGAGIGLWTNAMRALDHIGAGASVRRLVEPMTIGEFRGDRGHRVLLSYDAAALERRLGLPVSVSIVHRAELIAAFASLLPPDSIRLGHELVALQQKGDGATARFANGEAAHGNALIAADGLSSTTRSLIFGKDPPLYQGYTCWRGVCDVPFDRVPRGYVAEWWGVGQRCGIMRISNARVYWWATRNEPAGGRNEDEHAALIQHFAGWGEPFPSIIAATPRNSILRNDIFDRPAMTSWSRGRVCLFGDAAHPTTPNLGQGGCMAIEDAAALARCIRTLHNPESAFVQFHRERIARTTAITLASRRLGWIGQQSRPMLCRLRDACFGLAPDRVAFQMMLKWARHDVGPI